MLLQGKGKKKGQKSGRNKKASKNKNPKKNNKKSNLPHGGSDLSQKLYQTMEKHRDVRLLQNRISTS